VLSALLRRGETGRGGAIDTSLFETTLAWMGYHMTAYSKTGEVPGPQGSGSHFLAPYGAYRATDGDIMITAGNDNLFRKAIAALGRPELADDPRFQVGADRVRNRHALDAIITEVVGRESSEHWVAKLDAVGVPCAPAQTIDRIAEHPQTLALDILRRSEDGALSFVGLPLSFDGKRPNRNEPVPTLGQDTDAIFGETTR